MPRLNVNQDKKSTRPNGGGSEGRVAEREEWGSRRKPHRPPLFAALFRGSDRKLNLAEEEPEVKQNERFFRV